jgi:hypothetical protein
MAKSELGFWEERAIRKALNAMEEKGYSPKDAIKKGDYEALSTGCQTYWTSGLLPCEETAKDKENMVAPTNMTEITGITSTSIAVTGGIMLKPLAESLGYETVKSTGNVPPPQGAEIHMGEGDFYCYGKCEWEGADGYHHSYHPDNFFTGHDITSVNQGPDYGHALLYLSPLWILAALGFGRMGYRIWAAKKMTSENIKKFLDENEL